MANDKLVEVERKAAPIRAQIDELNRQMAALSGERTDVKVKSLADLRLSEQALAGLLSGYFCDGEDCDLGARLKAAGITDETLDTLKIAYKEQDMGSRLGTAIYNREAGQADQLSAILERVAVQQEDRVWAHYEAGRFNQALKEAQALEQVTFKAADPIDQLGQRFHALLREAGDDEARAWYEQAIAEMEADDEETPAVQPSAKVTDSGPMSKAKSYKPASDPWALASGADQTQASAVQSLDMRPLG